MANKTANMGGTAHDRFHRYTRPTIELAQRGGGNGKFTVLTNLGAVASAMRRSPESVLGFLTSRLSCGVHKNKAGQHEGLRGWHNAAGVEAALEAFVQAYVLCPVCGDAGTRIKTKGSGKRVTAKMKCGACGQRSPVDNAKLFHLALRGEEARDDKAPKARRRNKQRKKEKEKKRTATASNPDGWVFHTNDSQLDGWTDA